MKVALGTRGYGKWRAAYSAISVALVCSACGGGQTGDEFADVTGKVRGTAKATALTGEVPEETVDENWQFAWKAYETETDPTKNVVFSPYSIAVAGAMLVDGAAGDTHDEIRAAFNFTSGGDVFHQGRRELAVLLAQRNRDASDSGPETILQVSNDVWLRDGFEPMPDYLNVLSAFYDTELNTADFAGHPDRVRQAINAEVSKTTRKLIPELLPEDSVDSNTLLILTNALYFKATWSHTFDEQLTSSQAFRLNDGTEVMVPTMQGRTTTLYGTGPDFEAVTLRFSDFTMEFVAIVPKETPFETWITTLDHATVQEMLDLARLADVDLTMPKLNLEYDLPLKSRLMTWGMAKAFDAQEADFSPLSGERGPYLEDAFHSAKLAVNERGAEAGAATSLLVPVAMVPPVSLRLDRPFVFFIRDIATNTVLFVGHCVDPR